MSWSEKIWKEVVKKTNGKCVYCDIDLLVNFSIYMISSVEHIRPKIRGGSDKIENLTLSCIGCNVRLSKCESETIDERKNYLENSSSKQRKLFEILQKELNRDGSAIK